jgi:hypothetical protein
MGLYNEKVKLNSLQRRTEKTRITKETYAW